MRFLFSAIHAVTCMIAKDPPIGATAQTDIDIGTVEHALIGMDPDDLLKVTFYYRCTNRQLSLVYTEMNHLNRDNKLLENVKINGWGFNKSWALVRR